MYRPYTHVAVRPFRVTRVAADAHRRHAPAPFLGCGVCARVGANTYRSLFPAAR
jgi:hypothetical protein